MLQQFRFSGQHADEKILHVSRMHPVVLMKNIILIVGAATVILVFLGYFGQNEVIGLQIPQGILAVLYLSIVATTLLAFWWVWKVFMRTFFVITDRRLVKLGYHSPFTSYQVSANLTEIEDAAATARTILEQIVGAGTFYARSAPADRRDFWFEYLPFHRDIHNYVMKILYTLQHDPTPAETLKNFRPFVPRKAGERF